VAGIGRYAAARQDPQPRPVQNAQPQQRPAIAQRELTVEKLQLLGISVSSSIIENPYVFKFMQVSLCGFDGRQDVISAGQKAVTLPPEGSQLEQDLALLERRQRERKSRCILWVVGMGVFVDDAVVQHGN
jgi:hypothetical protein